jgi:hypothetical protein
MMTISTKVESSMPKTRPAPSAIWDAPEAERGTRPEQGGDDGEDVDDFAGPPVHGLAEQRPEDGGDQSGVAADVGGVGDGEAEDSEDGPGVGSPVEERVLEGTDRGVLRAGLGEAVRRGREVADRLGDAVADQADAHDGGDDHRQPGQGAEFGSVVGAAEDDGAEAAEGEPHQQDDAAEGDGEVDPPEVLRQPVHGTGQGVVEAVRGDRRPGDEGDDEGDGDPEHRAGSVAQGVGGLEGGGGGGDRVESPAGEPFGRRVGRRMGRLGGFSGRLRGCAHRGAPFQVGGTGRGQGIVRGARDLCGGYLAVGPAARKI